MKEHELRIALRYANRRKLDLDHAITCVKNKLQDEAFVRAVMLAIEHGHEHPPITAVRRSRA